MWAPPTGISGGPQEVEGAAPARLQQPAWCLGWGTQPQCALTCGMGEGHLVCGVFLPQVPV